MESIIPIGYWIFFIFTIVGTLVGLYKLFEKAGVPGWKALVPIYNLYICTKITHKKISWFIMLLIPVLNVVIWLLLANEISKVFGKESFWAYVGSMMIPFVYFPMIGFDDKVKYIGVHPAAKKSSGREWADAIAFAVVAATVIRTFFFEAFTIPTTSMESTLKAGDFLFVSKFHYGARFPITPIAFPFAHHTMPVLGTKAYSDKVQLPYMRFPGLEKIQHNSIVVFNFPEGDTVYLPNQQNSYYSMAMGQAESMRRGDIENHNKVKPFNYYYNITLNQYRNSGELAFRPVDKRDNYIKRCVGLPGDSISVVSGILYINGQQAYIAEHQQKAYDVVFKENIDSARCAEILMDLGVNSMDFEGVDHGPKNFEMNASMDKETAAEAKKNPNIISINLNHYDKIRYGSIGLYPHNQKEMPYSVDDFGPIWIPKKGATVSITPDNYCYFQRIIEAYEHNDVTRDKKGNVYIDGKQITQYTFKQNYYWMMGDNRHRSYDSRYWGFVPEDHIVGKPILIWFSWDKSKPFFQRLGTIRLSRMFRFV